MDLEIQNGVESGLISTVIPVFNRGAQLKICVESVLAQAYRPIEIIISDDGSIDDVPEVAEQLISEHPNVIRYVRHPNRGPGPAREAGRVLARGEFIQYLDSDDVLLPGKFELQVAALRGNPDCGIAYGITRLADEQGNVLAAPFKWTGKKRESLFPGLLVDRWWCTHTPLYRRSITDAIGSWSNLRYSQDWEYDARAGALGVRLAYTPDYVSEHRQHGGLRQTGSGKWLIPADRVRFFSALYACARRAGVGTDTPEMQHFARWVFSHARQCGEAGDSAAADALLRLAIEALGRITIDQWAFRGLVGLVGWSKATRWTEALRRVLGRTSGASTRKQSWMV